MARQTINVGSSANSGGGDALRDAMIKINDMFTELYGDVATLEAATGTDSGGTLVVNAIQGSVIGEDSTLIVDATTSTIDASRLTGTLPALDGSALTGISGGLADLVDDTTPQLGGNLDLNNFDITGTGNIPAANLTGTLPALDGSSLTGVTASSVAFADVTATPTTLAGYGITDAYTKTEVDNAITSSVLPSGSTQSIDIVAADSTLLVDSVNGTLNATTLTGALPAIDGSSLTGITTAFSNITSTPTTISGYGITDAFDGAFSSLSGTPTTISGYGITDAQAALVSGTNIKTVNGESLLGSGNITISGGSGGAAFTNIGVGADDSTIRSISEGESFLILGGTGVTTASDAEGNITITGFDGAFSSLSGTPTTLAGYGITDALTAGDALTGSGLEPTSVGTGDGNDLTLTGGDATELNSTGGDTNITGGSGALASGNVNIGTTQTVAVSIGASGVGTSIGGTLTANGNAIFNTGVQEAFDTLTSSTGTVTHDCDNGHVFYHTGATGDITANFTNLGLTAEYGTNLTVIINQGATPYEVTAVQIGGVAQTINWQGGTPPTGNANGIDSFSFTILRDGSSYVVLGQMVDFT